MSYESVSAAYPWLERFLAGPVMQRCRCALLPEIPGSQRILLIGEGHGRFLVECLRAFPAAQITCVDESPGMLRQARLHVQKSGLPDTRVAFYSADVLAPEWSPDPAAFDLLVTHFFLDCFRPDQLKILIPKLATAIAPGGHWLISDFQIAKSGWRRWRSRAIVQALYLFFRLTSQISARSLSDPEPWLSETGRLTKVQEIELEWGLMRSSLWKKS